MHQDGATGVSGDGGGHGGVPGEAADIIDDFGSGMEGAAGDGGFVCVDGEDGVRALLPDRFDDGQDAVDLLLGGDGSGKRGSLAGCGGRAGAGGFAADIEDVGTFIEKRQSVGDGGLGREKLASVGEGIRGDVEHAHDERALPERERAAADIPLEAGAHGKGDCSRRREQCRVTRGQQGTTARSTNVPSQHKEALDGDSEILALFSTGILRSC